MTITLHPIMLAIIAILWFAFWCLTIISSYDDGARDGYFTAKRPNDPHPTYRKIRRRLRKQGIDV